MKQVKIKQTISVNKMQKKKVEDEDYPLEVGDICTLSTESLKMIYFKFLPVLVTGLTTTGKEQNTR
jgi:hypothetical protein